MFCSPLLFQTRKAKRSTIFGLELIKIALKLINIDLHLKGEVPFLLNPWWVMKLSPCDRHFSIAIAKIANNDEQSAANFK